MDTGNMEKKRIKRTGLSVVILVFIIIAVVTISLDIYTNINRAIDQNSFPELNDEFLFQIEKASDTIQVPDSLWKEPEWIGR